MKDWAWLGCAGTIGLLSGCGTEAASEAPSISSVEEALMAPESGHGNCGDHADDERLDTAEARTEAARAVVWRSPKLKKSPTVQAKILGFNDFHGQLVEGCRVSNRPVGGAAVLASYLKEAQVGYEGSR